MHSGPADTITTTKAIEVRVLSLSATIERESPPKLVVDAPLPELLPQGAVFIQYRTENIRVVAFCGNGMVHVSTRVEHIHITIDHDWRHCIDASGDTVVVVGMDPDPHRPEKL